TPVAVLTKNLYGGISANQYAQALNGAPTAKIQGDGTFVFKPLRQGVYDLAWGSIRSNGSASFSFTSYGYGGQPVFVATIGPLCAFDFGDINQDIPTAP